MNYLIHITHYLSKEALQNLLCSNYLRRMKVKWLKQKYITDIDQYFNEKKVITTKSGDTFPETECQINSLHQTLHWHIKRAFI
jgi:glucose-6-phosphate 1-dehydrogenase